MDYGCVTKLVHASRNHQSFISKSFTNHTHQIKRAIELQKWAIEFQRQKLSSEFRDYFESIYQELIEKFRIRFISYFRIFEN